MSRDQSVFASTESIVRPSLWIRILEVSAAVRDKGSLDQSTKWVESIVPLHFMCEPMLCCRYRIEMSQELMILFGENQTACT